MSRLCHDLILRCTATHVTDELKAHITPENIDTIFGHDGVFTPLKTACAYSRTAVVKWLLEKGASPHVSDSSGYAPLHSLCIHVHNDPVASLRLLLAAGADVNAKTTCHVTALDMMDLSTPTPIILLMLHAGARLNNRTNSPPSWFVTVISAREQCRQVALVFAGLLRLRHVLPKDICVMLGKFIWATRGEWMDDALAQHAQNDSE